MTKDNRDTIISQYILDIFKNTYFGNHLFKVGEQTYVFKKDITRDEKHLLDFGEDFKNYWTHDTLLKVTIDDDAKSSSGFTSEFFVELMNPFYYQHAKLPIDINGQEFKKLLVFFEFLQTNSTISMLFKKESGCNIGTNPYHFEFTKEILSLDLKWTPSPYSSFWSTITSDMNSLMGHYYSEKNPLIIEGLINYFKNKKELLEKNKDNYYEDEVLKSLKKILHSDHWAEFASYLPSYSEKIAKKNKNSSIFSAGVNPVYYVSLNKSNLLSLSSSTVTDDDMFMMMVSICDSLNETKPNEIDKIELTNPIHHNKGKNTSWDNPRVFLSGKNLNQGSVEKFMSLLEKMIIEYNSDNVDKRAVIYSHMINEIEKNQTYLNTAAANHWLAFELEVELDGSNTVNRKKLKI